MQKKSLPKQKPNLSPNFLNPVETKKLFTPAKNSYVVRFSEFFIVTLMFVFLSLLVLNRVLDSRLTELKRTQDVLLGNLNDFRSLENTIIKLSEYVDMYENTISKKRALTNEVEFLFDSCPEEVVFSSFAYAKRVYIFTGQAKEPLSFGLLISNYLGNEDVEKIVITSVTFDDKTEVYLSEMEVFFK